MTKFIIDLNLDGYDSEEEHDNACKEYIEDQLDSAGSSVKIEKLEDAGSQKALEMLKEFGLKYEFKSCDDGHRIIFETQNGPVVWTSGYCYNAGETVWTRIIDFINESKEDKNSWYNKL